MKAQGSSRLAPSASASGNARGPERAEISLVEYADFECPYCRAAEAIVRGLRETLGDRLSVVYRHFPMREVHPHAQHAAEVAEAAARQGRFWQMHDHLYAHQDALDDESLLRYARELGLDAERVGEELASHAHARLVAEDHRRGLADGVLGTPAFFVDGARYDGSLTLRDLLAFIRERHPDVDAQEISSSGPRVPRVKWPRRAPA